MASNYAGYMGKVMMVDLTAETVTEYPWSDEQRQLYLGGKIMAARILCDHLTGKETAFSEENWLVISTGPLTGTGAPALPGSIFPPCLPRPESWHPPTAAAASASI